MTPFLKKNDVLARALRERFDEAGVFVVSLVSSPGAGKTTLLERPLSAMKPTHRVAALVGDLQTDNDARRLAAAGVPVRQITTGTVCHLDAQMVEDALGGWQLADLDLLFIENVGNLVCPAAYDLGETSASSSCRSRIAESRMSATSRGQERPVKNATFERRARRAR